MLPAPESIGRACLCLQSRMTARAVTRTYDAALKPLGLKTTQFSLLVAVAHGAARSLTQLAETLAMERTTLVRNVALMVGKGLVAEVPAGRATRLALTESGQSLVEKALPLWQSAQAAIEGRLAEADVPDVRGALRSLRRAAQPRRRVPAARASA